MGVGTSFGYNLGGIHIGTELNKESFYIGLNDTFKVVYADNSIEYYHKCGECFYNEYLKQDIDFLMLNISRCKK